MKRRLPSHADLERWLHMLRQERELLHEQARGVAKRVQKRIGDRSNGSRDVVREKRVSFGVAAILLAALCVNVVAPSASVPVAPDDATAGPIEAKQRLEQAKAHSIGKHWLVQVGAYQDVARMASPSDRTRVSALKAKASAYAKGGRSQAALAAYRHIASHGPDRDGSRLRALLAYAKGLRKEHDLDAARSVAEAVVELASSAEPKVASSALAPLAKDAFEREDATRLDVILREMDRFGAPVDVRIRMLGRLGELHLEQDDNDAARKALRRAKTLYLEISEKDDQAARKATKVWMDLPLRKRF